METLSLNKPVRKTIQQKLPIDLDFDDPEVQKNMFEAASLMAYQSGLPVMGAFMQSQAGLAELKAGSCKQDKELLLLEHLVFEDQQTA